jgi:hypothetical protein
MGHSRERIYEVRVLCIPLPLTVLVHNAHRPGSDSDQEPQRSQLRPPLMRCPLQAVIGNAG